MQSRREALEGSGAVGLLNSDSYVRILDRIAELGKGACESNGSVDPLKSLCSCLYKLHVALDYVLHNYFNIYVCYFLYRGNTIA